MVDYVKAIKRPFTDLKKLCIGIFFSLPIPLVSLFTNVAVSGYALQAGKFALENKSELPKWEDYGRLWLNGFLSGIIVLIYSIPIIILLFTVGNRFIIDYIRDRVAVLSSLVLQGPISFIESYGTGLIVTLLVSLIIGYFTPAAVLRFIQKGDFKSGFDIRYIFSKAFTSKYLVATVLISIVGVLFFVGELYYSRYFFGPYLGELSDFSLEKSLWALLVSILSAVISSILGFIYSIITFTIYGEVLKELK